MTVRIDIKFSYFSGLWLHLHLHLFVIPLFIFSYFTSFSVSTILNSSVILDGNLTLPQCWPGILHWCITVFFSSTLLLLPPLSSMLSCFTWTKTGNETGSPYNVLGDFLDLCETIIPTLNCYPRSPLTKTLFLVMIEALIVFRNGHKNMVLHAIPYTRARGAVTGCPFTTKGVW